MKILLFKLSFTIILCSYLLPSFSQNWIAGYSYRKKITINKSKVTPTIDLFGQGAAEYKDLVNFPVYIEITDPDLIHTAGSCGNKIQNIYGKDISFTLVGSTTPLNFQLESYDAETGKITCWVKIPLLSADGSPSIATSFYFYYGSDILHDPYSTQSLNVWADDYTSVWHMNQDELPAVTKNARATVPGSDVIGGPGTDADNYVNGKLGKGIALNGNSDSFNSSNENSTVITISAWVKLNAIGTEQMIVTNDSLRMVNSTGVTDGYKLKINSSGQPVFELYRSSSIYSIQAKDPLLVNTWYYITGISMGTDISLFVNGVRMGGRVGSPPRLGVGGSIKIGASKQSGSYLNGTLDELRIQRAIRSPEWLKTEYTNQINPTEFYIVSAGEYNPADFPKFIGTVNSAWDLPSNWSNNQVPGQNANIVIAAGKTLDFTAAPTYEFNKVALEVGAKWIIRNITGINCTATIDKNATIKIEDNATLKFHAEVINNGLITSGQTSGTLVFSGRTITQRFRGTGTAQVSRLEINPSPADSFIELSAPIEVFGQVLLTKGTLKANSNLTLLASQTSSAAILPVGGQASITGNVHVQKYITGDFSQPATARGWRLLTSPVYNTITNGLRYYNVSAMKNAMFITGPGGTANGFDQSLQNGNTIFTHDQSLPGTLSQKFVPIANIPGNIPFGNGIYVFSRGNRNVPDAYTNQVLAAPFSNPSGYVITYTGQIYTGELSVTVNNKKSGSEGDGFNLLGNPYASPLTWGNLNKTNVSPYIWLFDPLNNAYIVSDNASTIIPSGAGFFVKVNNNSSTGEIRFTELSKYMGTGSYAKYASSFTAHDSAGEENISHLTVDLGRDGFKQSYKVLFSNGGSDEVTDEDALKIGDGYVSIAGWSDGKKLSIDRRGIVVGNKEIKLHVQGWASGNYTLTVNGVSTFNNSTGITLIDRYTKQHEKLRAGRNSYNFEIDLNKAESQGSDRFSLLFEHNKLPTVVNKLTETLYPNPFSDKLYIKSNRGDRLYALVLIRNSIGETVSRQQISLQNSDLELEVEKLVSGIYFVQLIDTMTKNTISTFKVFKN